MPDEQNIQRIIAYVVQHRDAYTLDVLRQQLLAAGYNPDDVDAAFARIDRPPQPIQPAPVSEAPAPQPISQAPASEAPVAPPTDDQATIQRIVDYLERNRRQYTIEALRQQLLGQGQRPELVEAALARVQTTPAKRAGVLLPALPWAGGALLLSLLGAWISLIDSFDWVGFWFIAALFFGGLGVLMLLAGAVVQAFRRSLGLAILFGGLIVLALSALGVVIFFGVCLVLLYQFTV